MILAQVQAYINDNGPITMHQITKHFGMEAQALQGMLQILMRKGLIEQLQQAPTCNGCTSCGRERHWPVVVVAVVLVVMVVLVEVVVVDEVVNGHTGQALP